MQDVKASITKEYSSGTKMALLVVMSALACALTSLYTHTFMIPDGPNSAEGMVLLVMIHAFPLALLCALYNSDTAVISFAVVLFFGIIFLGDTSTVFFINLVYIFIAAVCKRLGCYRSVPSVLAAIIAGSVITGLLYSSMYSVYFRTQLFNVNYSVIVQPMLAAVCQNLFIHIVIYLVFRFMPSGIVGLFPPGEFRNDTREAAGGASSQLVKNRLSMKMLLVLTAEAAIMILGAVLLANFAAPSLSGELKNLSIDEYIGFDLRLAVLLVELVVPVIVIIRMIFDRNVAVPVRNIAECMAEYYGSDRGKARKRAAAKLEELNIKTGDEIQNLHETLVAAQKDVKQYIYALKEEQKLKEELSAAQAANRARINFLSRVSHEIRTPINSILGFDEMIQRESTEPEIKKYAADIQDSGRTLLSIINDILDSSSIESGKLEIIPVEYETAPMISDLVNMTKLRAGKKGLELNVNVDPNLPSALLGDEIRIKQCILNILTNSVKFTKEGSVTLDISFRSAESEGFIYLKAQVTDTSKGMKQKDLEMFFRPFDHADEDLNGNPEGTGLEMSVVRNLLNMMGSNLEISSVFGGGCDFSFEVLQKVVKEEPIGGFADNFLKASEDEGDYRESFQAPDARILVVDDMKLNLSVFCGLLKNTRVVIDAIESGFAAIKMVQENRYDVIFLDQRMPDMDGTETLKILKTMEGNLSRKAPVIVLTANAVSGMREEYIAEGFDDYVSKPVDGRKLEYILRQYLPPSKIYFPGHPNFISGGGIAKGTSNAPAGGNKSGSEDPRITAFKSIPGVSYAAAIKNCSSDDLLLDTAENFVADAKDLSEAVRRFHSEKDYENVTIKVHAIKSSAGLLGAEKLSEDAEYLEKCGDEGKYSEIDSMLDAFLSDYESLCEKMADAIKPSAKAKEEGKPVTEEELKEAYSALRELMEAMDYDGAEDILNTLEGRAVPEGEAEKFEKIKSCVRRLDREEALELLKV